MSAELPAPSEMTPSAIDQERGQIIRHRLSETATPADTERYHELLTYRRNNLMNRQKLEQIDRMMKKYYAHRLRRLRRLAT